MWNSGIKKSLEFSQQQELFTFLWLIVLWYSTDQDKRSFDNICEFQGNWSWLEPLIEAETFQPAKMNRQSPNKKCKWFAVTFFSPVRLWLLISFFVVRRNSQSCWQYEVVKLRICILVWKQLLYKKNRTQYCFINLCRFTLDYESFSSGIWVNLSWSEHWGGRLRGCQKKRDLTTDMRSFFLLTI